MSARPAGPASRRTCFLVLTALGLLVLGPALRDAPRHKGGDYGPHHVLTRALARGLADGHVPRYLTGVSTGDSPFELYPLPAYALAAFATLVSGDESHAPQALLGLGALCHVGMAALVARLASHFAPLPLALTLGAFALLDLGSFESGGGNSVLEVGLVHGALAQCLLLGCLDLALLCARQGASRRRAAGLWLLAGLAAVTHPSSLLFLAALLLALVASAALSVAGRPRHALATAFHVAIGVLLSAAWWLPFAARVLEHGLHFAYPGPPVLAALGELLSLRQPPSSFPMLMALGYAGLLTAFWRRQAAGVALAVLCATLLLGWSELPLRLFWDWLPRTLSRLQSFRLLTLARPLLLVAAALPLAAAWRLLRSRPPLLGLAFPAGTLALGSVVVLCAATRGPSPGGGAALRAAATNGVPDPAGFDGLLAWARQTRGDASPDRFARLMWLGFENEIYHLAADAGLPAFFLGDGVAMLLRERIEDDSEQSLRRFDVRFLAARGRELDRGDPGTERRFGSYVVRELPSWDGQLARVEKGAGRARVVALQDELVEVELLDTDRPALVALGLGYYGRWRAERPDGTPVPVYAVPATPGGSVRVLAAWLAPGRTRFRADAALASDRIGRAPSALGAALLGLTLLGGTPRGRRRLAPWLARRRARGTAAALLAAAAAGALLLACAPRSEEHSLRLLRGAFPHAHVEARIPGGEWTPCRFAALLRDYECPGLGRIGDGVAFVLQDHPSSTPFLTPAIVARPEQARVEYRVRATGRFSGSYWAAGWGPGSGTLGCGGSALPLTRRKQALAPAPGATAACEVVLRTRGRALQGATLVRADALDLDRTRDVPWAPPEPTASPGPPRRP